MRSSVIVFPGSNCDRDVAVALEKFQIKNQMVWHDESNLPKSDLVVFPGGFSYGDYLRTGCIASKSKIINDVLKHASKGGLVLGICNGFQILTECELLPGVLMRNKKMNFICKYTYLISKHENNWVSKNFVDKVISMPVAHHDGNYYADDKVIEILNKDNRIAYQYCSDKGIIDDSNNINGSINNIAGIFNNKGNVLGMMPHPERAIDSSLGGEDGINFFKTFFEKLG